jgi:acetylornithine/N-succinyldiaminopimelate aminotransferase
MFTPRVYLPHPVIVSHERFPNIIVDIGGNEYVDFLSNDGSSFLHSYGVNTAAGREEVQVLLRCMEKYISVTNFLNADERGEWAETIGVLTGYDMVFPLCSGSEANDAAIKLALKRHWLDTTDTGYVIAMNGCYFGRTIGANSASAGTHKAYTDGIGYHTQILNASREEFLELTEFHAKHGSLAGVMMEVLPGRDLRGGFLTVEWLADLFALRREYGFSIIVDEIKSGGGRMGQFLASSIWEEKPDIVTMSKALANGLPMAAVLGTEAVYRGIDSSWHSSTMGGNPALCAYSMHLMSKVTLGMLSSVRERGEYLSDALHDEGFEHVGRGLHQNIFLHDAMTIRDRLIGKGFLVYCIRDDYICIMPNIHTTITQIDEFMEALNASV